MFSGNGISGSATQKIVELSRKNRDTHSELTKEKSRVRLLQNQLSKLLAENTKQQQQQEVVVVLCMVIMHMFTQSDTYTIILYTVCTVVEHCDYNTIHLYIHNIALTTVIEKKTI